MDRNPTPSSAQDRGIQVGTNPSPLPLDAGTLFFLKECQDVLRPRLSEPLLQLFHDLTGLALHVIWQQPLESGPSANQASLCPSTRRFQDSGGGLADKCRRCLEEHWEPATLRTSETRQFRGACGLTNLCVGIRGIDVCPVLLVVQATIDDEGHPEPGRALAACAEFGHQQACSPTDAPITREMFTRAESLLDLILHDLETTLLARLAQRELESAQRHPRQLSATDDRPQEEAGGRLVQGKGLVRTQAQGRHARQVVQAMLDYVRDHYQRPMALKEVAASLGMNANYLSGLFHRSTGTTFHRYLNAVRMSKAEELLRDPRARICDVANAVGYASPNHFRNAFKACERLSPTAWTEAQPSERRES